MYLMTQSLLSSWMYSMKDNPYDDGTKNPMDDFLVALNRERGEPSEAMLNGINFENLVTDILSGENCVGDEWYEAAQAVSSRLEGSQLQVAIKRETIIDGTPILLYGRVDALKAGVIYDIKFTSNYDVGKFYDSPQHPMYLSILPEAYAFEYLASDGRNVWNERYLREETRDIEPIVADFLRWLRMTGLIKIYEEKWKSAQ